MRCWLHPDLRTAFALVEDGAVRGYGIMLAACAGGSPVFLDLPEPNRAAVELATRYGLSPVFETARMYRGEDPGLPLAKTYGITTFELG
jgi:hypothetical protein